MFSSPYSSLDHQNLTRIDFQHFNPFHIYLNLPENTPNDSFRTAETPDNQGFSYFTNTFREVFVFFTLRNGTRAYHISLTRMAYKLQLFVSYGNA